jgi:hypothetical protein
LSIGTFVDETGVKPVSVTVGRTSGVEVGIEDGVIFSPGFEDGVVIVPEDEDFRNVIA